MATVSQGLADELMCSICLDIFSCPVILPCAHTFCKQCLVNVHERSRFRRSFRHNTTTNTSGSVRGVNITTTTDSTNPDDSNTPTTKQKLTCPHCRSEVQLGPGGINSLPRNTTVANIILSLEEEKKARNVTCEVCDDDPPRTATKVCSDCCVTYCTICFRQLHPMRGSFRYHVIKETNQTIPFTRCTSPVLDHRGSVSGRCTPSLDGTDVESGDEGGSMVSQDVMEKIRKQIKSKRRELNNAMKNVQAMLKSTEEDTEERMREVRSVCSQITECVSEREITMLTAIGQQRHETIRQCIALTGEIKTQTDRLDHLEDQVHDVTTVKAVYASPDIGNYDIISLQSKLLEIQTKPLISKSKSIIRHPRIADNIICQHIQALDFQKDSDLPSPVFTALECIPVAQGPALVNVCWSVIPGATKYNLSATKKDNQGNEVRLSLQLDPSTTSYQLGLPSMDTDYVVKVDTQSNEGSHPAICKKVRTLPYVQCLKIKFNSTTCHKRVAVSLTKDEIVHRKCKLASLHNACPSTTSSQRLETLEGATSDESLPVMPHVYWQHVIHFHVFGRLSNSRLLCDLGICKQGTEDSFTPLCDNSNSYVAYLVRRNTKICLEFWNGTKRENLSRSIPVLDLDNDTDKTIKLGFYYNAIRKIFAVISPGNNTVLCRFNVKYVSVLPVYALYSTDQVFVMIRSSEAQKLPHVLYKLMTDG